MEELDLKKLFELFWSKKIYVAIIVMIFAVIGVIYTVGFVTPIYKSSTTLVLVKSSNTGSGTTAEQETGGAITTTDITLNSKLVATYRDLIKSKSVVREVISNLGIKDLEENDIRKNISVENREDTEVIEITVANENAMYAAKIANELAKVFTQKIAEGIYDINNVHIVDEAEVAQGPSNINHVKDVLIFIVIGFVVAIAYILIINILDTTIKTTEDVEKALGLPVLASIPIYEFDSDKGGKR